MPFVFLSVTKFSNSSRAMSYLLHMSSFTLSVMIAFVARLTRSSQSILYGFVMLLIAGASYKSVLSGVLDSGFSDFPNIHLGTN